MSGGGGYKLDAVGSTGGSTVSAGNVGEFISSTVPAASALPLASNVATDVTYIDITAGTWDISGNVGYVRDATVSTTALQASFGTVSGAINTPYSNTARHTAMVVGASTTGMPINRQILTVTSTARVYLVAKALFTVSNLSAFGVLNAVRVATA